MSHRGVVVDVGGLFDVFRRFHFLKVNKEIESLILTSLITCLPSLVIFLGGLGRRGCYIEELVTQPISF